MFKIDHTLGISLGDQWFRLRTSNAGAAGLISDWGTKIFLHAAKKKKKKSSNQLLDEQVTVTQQGPLCTPEKCQDGIHDSEKVRATRVSVS